MSGMQFVHKETTACQYGITTNLMELLVKNVRDSQSSSSENKLRGKFVHCEIVWKGSLYCVERSYVVKVVPFEFMLRSDVCIVEIQGRRNVFDIGGA